MSSNSWSWPNGDYVDYGLADYPGSGPHLVIDVSDFKLHAANYTNVAGPQCEAGKNKSYKNTRLSILKPVSLWGIPDFLPCTV